MKPHHENVTAKVTAKRDELSNTVVRGKRLLKITQDYSRLLYVLYLS